MKKQPTTVEQGKHAEQLARRYLQDQSLTLITQNFRTKFGEIDLIMQDKDYLVFVEVRLRNNADYGSGADTITANKQRRLRNTAHFYLQTNYGNRFPKCRFDVVSMITEGDSTQFDWIKNALS
jgi:putative endonuclease